MNELYFLCNKIHFIINMFFGGVTIFIPQSPKYFENAKINTTIIECHSCYVKRVKEFYCLMGTIHSMFLEKIYLSNYLFLYLCFYRHISLSEFLTITYFSIKLFTIYVFICQSISIYIIVSLSFLQVYQISNNDTFIKAI